MLLNSEVIYSVDVELQTLKTYTKYASYNFVNLHDSNSVGTTISSSLSFVKVKYSKFILYAAMKYFNEFVNVGKATQEYSVIGSQFCWI